MSLDFFDRSGAAVAYSDDGEHIYLYSGKPVAYLSDDAVYSFSGKHIGWFEDGCLWDTSGYCILFTPSARSGPIRPVRQVRPIKGVRHVRAVKGVRQVRAIKPIRSMSWSSLTIGEFFA